MDFLSKNSNRIRLIIILLAAFICMSFFVIKQPFGDGPDEINRYKVVEYIRQFGSIPRGDANEIIIDGYGASYAFQPILTYIIEGYVLRILNPLNLSAAIQLIIARYINVLFGLIAAFYTYKISRYVFSDDNASFLFTLAVVLLPQNIFIYTYVNTDGLALLSVTLMIYALLRGYSSDFDKNSCIAAIAGIVLCLLSYYNCYGYILTSFMAFIACFVFKKDYKNMYKKGSFIIAGVLLLAGWWFVRNALLYNGDILALTARKECAAQTGNILWLENMANTYQSQGYSIYEMVFKTDYYTLVWKSFIGMFGPMSIPTHHYVYMGYKYIFIICLLGLLIPKASGSFKNYSTKQKVSFWTFMVINMIIPAALSVYYSYTYDFQPQGRYYLPALLPLVCIASTGANKLIDCCMILLAKLVHKEKTLALAKAFIYHILYMFFFLSLIISVYLMLKYYASIL